MSYIRELDAVSPVIRQALDRYATARMLKHDEAQAAWPYLEQRLL